MTIESHNLDLSRTIWTFLVARLYNLRRQLGSLLILHDFIVLFLPISFCLTSRFTTSCLVSLADCYSMTLKPHDLPTSRRRPQPMLRARLRPHRGRLLRAPRPRRLGDGRAQDLRRVRLRPLRLLSHRRHRLSPRLREVREPLFFRNNCRYVTVVVFTM